jgi:hypothetical protein
LALNPRTPGACPLELMVRADQRYDIQIGTEFYEDSQWWRISYTGGTGNDVVLTRITPTPAQTWQGTNFGTNANNPLIAGNIADPDYDGIANLLERALGLNPTTVSNTGLPAGSLIQSGSSNFLTLTVIKSSAASDLTYTVEVSGDLTLWNSGTTHTTILDNTPTLLRVRDNIPLSSGTRRFMHLKVSP